MLQNAVVTLTLGRILPALAILRQPPPGARIDHGFRLTIDLKAAVSLYADSNYPVRDEIVAVHARQLSGIVSPGTWGTGAQRRAVAAQARLAGYEAGVLEPPSGGPEEPDIELSAATRRVVHTIAAAVPDLDQAFCEQALADGLDDVEYVELVGVVARIVDLDVFARGIGVSPRSLPQAEPGDPARERPDSAVVEQAWVPTIPNGSDGGTIGAALYQGHPMPYIVRALSLVPAELRAHLELEIAHYTRLDKLFDYDYQHHEGLTRPQAEVVAGRVSALNDCFY